MINGGESEKQDSKIVINSNGKITLKSKAVSQEVKDDSDSDMEDDEEDSKDEDKPTFLFNRKLPGQQYKAKV